jgi:hypothetical protein
MDRHVLISSLPESGGGELVIGTFGFLKAKDVRAVPFQKLLDERHAQPHGIDVPGGDGEGHGDSPG